MTDRRIGSPHASNRRWNDTNCAGVSTFAVRKTVSPRTKPNSTAMPNAAAGLAVSTPTATVRNTAAVMM